jgi:hypothetical protein
LRRSEAHTFLQMSFETQTALQMSFELDACALFPATNGSAAIAFMSANGISNPQYTLLHDFTKFVCARR